MKKQILRDIITMLLFWAIFMALDSYDWAFDVVDDFEDVVSDLMPWASSSVIEQTNAIIWISVVTTFCSFAITKITNFCNGLFAKK